MVVRSDDSRLHHTIAQAASALAASPFSIALTGAGLSTESGLPDFRSPGGLWGEYDPMEVATLSAFRRTPEKFYDFYRQRWPGWLRRRRMRVIRPSRNWKPPAGWARSSRRTWTGCIKQPGLAR
ncbi:MAG TPA: Sir2 family NAD-dependent protein deacetylase [bacterium]|nr:Sir2 family NAD-dependent protein deacetylase [bacterium]